MHIRLVPDTLRRSAATVLLAVSVLTYAGHAQAEAPDTIVLDPHMDWRTGDGVQHPTESYRLDRNENGLRVEVLELGHGVVLNMPVPLYIDTEQVPILTMTYRATGLDLSNPDDAVVAFWGGKPSYLPAVQNKDVLADGQEHRVRIDMRDRLAEHGATAKALVWLDLRVRALPKGSAVFELIDLRFGPDGETTTAADKGQPANPVTVRVTDASDQPIASALVTLDAHTKNLRVVAETDADGRATLHSDTPGLTGTRRSLSVTKDGMTTMSFRDLHQVDADTQLQARLYKTQTLSGSVVDEQGQPIPNAVGQLWFDGVPRPQGPGRPGGLQRVRITSDADGRWSSPSVPADNNLSAQVRWLSKDYLQDQWGGQYSGRLSMPNLQNGLAVSILKRGVELTGVVTDKDGKPIHGATVAQGDDRFPSNAPPATATDSSGMYHFQSVPPGALTLTVMAKGHAPELIQTQAVEGMDPIDFSLKGSATFRFRIVDPQGNPLEGIGFSADTWRGYRTLAQTFWSDADGLAVWEGPTDSVQFDIYARDHMRQEITTGPAIDENDITEIVMHEPMTITVNVTDAETGDPVKHFNVLTGILWQNDGNQKPHWQRNRDNAEPGKDGRWEQKFTFNYPYRAVRIEAEGYAPVSSEPISKEVGSVELSFGLQRAESLTGTLLDTQGNPIAGQTVYLSTGRGMPQIRNGRIVHRRDLTTATTNDQGIFSFPPQDDDYLLVILSDSGFAEIDANDLRSTKGIVTLSPWATISGQLLIGDEPRAGEQVSVWQQRMYDLQKPRPYHDLKATTDELGNFAIDRVPPGKGGVGRYIQLSENSWGMTSNQTFDAAPGETIVVKIGGIGRPVVGQLAWPSDTQNKSFNYGQHRLSTKLNPNALMDLRKQLLPEDYATWNVEQQQDWAKTDQGKNVIDKLKAASTQINGTQRNYSFTIDPDGRFRIENVEPGTYQLTLQVNDPPPANQSGNSNQIAKLRVDVTVPALPVGAVYLSEPLDLGTHTLTTIKPAPKVGQAAPDFTVPLLNLKAQNPEAALENAQQLSLSDLRGKLVLLDFWATWCGPCVAETPNLKAVWDSFGTDGRFEMIALSLDQSPKAPTDYANKNQIAWKQAYLGEWSLATVPNDYAVRGIPSIWLIGPDGNIIAKNLRGNGIRAAVEKALGGLPQ
jgi:protocatechuate 3,4-dioxygenase beta subunit/thiol-disulfide isomerase/thioredoxin